MVHVSDLASGQGWPNLDDSEIVVVGLCLAATFGLCWWIGYIIWRQVQMDRLLARRRREKRRKAEEAKRADRELDLQMQAEGWPSGEGLPVERITEIVKRGNAVHYKMAAAVTRGKVR